MCPCFQLTTRFARFLCPCLPIPSVMSLWWIFGRMFWWIFGMLMDGYWSTQSIHLILTQSIWKSEKHNILSIFITIHGPQSPPIILANIYWIERIISGEAASTQTAQTHIYLLWFYWIRVVITKATTNPETEPISYLHLHSSMAERWSYQRCGFNSYEGLFFVTKWLWMWI